MGKIVLLIFFIAVSVGGVLYVFKNSITEKIVEPIAKDQTIFEKPLAKYSYQRLRKTTVPAGTVTLGEVVKEDDDFTSRMFYFKDGDKKVSGLLNLPLQEGTYPVIIMFRGFVERDAYTTGEGTRRTAEEFARNGYITLAPDFLGYGESDMPSEKSIEERFQTYTTALAMLSSVKNLNTTLATDSEISQTADLEKIGLWAHSNGGQIALSALVVTGQKIPTVLWAPVTKPFPYNILYFTDEFDDEGKALRKVVADFERDYDVYDYSVVRYLSRIKAPMQLHQGSVDEAVPQRWSDQFDALLKDKEIDHEYFVYSGENHNFNNGSWPLAVSRSISFYESNFATSSARPQ